MSDLVIGPGKTVTLHFAIKLDDGQLVDSNFEGSPATFTVGDGNLLEGFEQALFGLKAGDAEALSISPEKGFGAHNPSNIQRIPRAQFKDMELEPGLVISFADAGSGELPGVILDYNDDNVQVDFNHPLAGKAITFEVQILQVEEA
ncbi:FKBP-type peptidyl-prolyl cis-trans isomerase [Marinobacterium jannaschii]|uniref:FKBP-type peptidyl-prolyl cis-trans isomerase n=1 Tax=Marinobacterium jannaschii TaxID=64970 RepID=UPI00048627B9|nr:peptidylprolyl isomerase [Marinobacterium jannaschii]